MAKKDYKQAGKNIAGEIKQRGISEFLGRINNVLSNTSNNILKFVPTPIRSLLPFIANELDIKAPSADDLFNKLTGKSEQELAAVQEDLQSRESATFQQIPEEINTKYPPLKIGDEIIGNHGNYQIKEFLGYRHQRDFDQKRYFYQAMELPESEPLIIEEFLFPKPEDAKKENIKRKLQDIQYDFQRSSGLKLADGRSQDCRLITPDEAIFDMENKRYYLVFKNSVYHGVSLGSYIRENGAMSNIEVYQVLNQVLQSLQFLHTQKFLLPSGIEYGEKDHGNLTLDNLLIVPSLQGFLIYLRDLALWEHQYIDENIQANIKVERFPKNRKDLQDKDLQELGKIGHCLLTGNQDIELPDTVHPKLKEFLEKLSNKEFVSAEKAREKLSEYLTKFPDLVKETKLDEEDEDTKNPSNLPFNFTNLRLLLLGSCGILLLFGGIFWLLTNSKKQEDKQKETLKSLEKIAGIPQGKFTYTAAKEYTSTKEPDGIWDYLMRKVILTGRENLDTKLKTILPNVQLNYQDYQKPTTLDYISKVKNREIDFAISTIVENNKNSELGYEEFAYDGLVVFVAFSKEGREDSLPKTLQGKISLEQLQKIYTGEITNWKDVKGINGPDLKIKLYMSPNKEIVEKFKQRVLKTEENITKFEILLKQTEINDKDEKSRRITQLDETLETFRTILKDFENESPKIGSIGFDSLSRVYGQCSIYPLALQDGNKPAISPLMQLNGQPINPQKTDLCNKSSYTTNSQQFINQNYPLAYPLSVVYLRDNRQEPKGKKFAEVLKSREVQCLLKDAGLATLQPLNNTGDCQVRN